MRITKTTGWTLAAVALLASAGSAWAAGTLQKTPGGVPKGTAPIEKKVDVTPPLKVEATALAVTPATNLKAGDQVTVTLTIRNTGTAPVARVPWAIHVYTGNQTLARGEQTNVGAGATFQVTAQWTAKGGQHRLQGYVDPEGKAFKNTAPAATLNRELMVTVSHNVALAAPTQPAPAPAARETRVLDHTKAKLAGANFSEAFEEIGRCMAGSSGGRSSQPGFLGVRANDPQVVVISLNCVSGAVTGGRVNFQLYSGFRLKNGWRIVSVDPQINREGPRSDVRWDSELPRAGSDDPSMRVHLWAEPLSAVRVDIKTTIEGPAGTDPYR